MAGDRDDRIALDPTGRHVAIRSDTCNDWFVFDTAAAKGIFSSSLPEDWTRYVPATERDRLAEEVERLADEAEGIASGLEWLRRRAAPDPSSDLDTGSKDPDRSVPEIKSSNEGSDGR